jgi:hypothetical protein
MEVISILLEGEKPSSIQPLMLSSCTTVEAASPCACSEIFVGQLTPGIAREVALSQAWGFSGGSVLFGGGFRPRGALHIH